MGNLNFYGPGMTIDSTKPVQVITQFITDDGTDTGTLSAVKRFYVQNGVTYAQPNSQIAGITGNTIDTAFCTAAISIFDETTSFTDKGGMAGVSAALEAGVVLVMSLWDDYAVNMLWLDSTYPTNETASTPGAARGTCSTSSGVPATVESQNADAYVIYSDIRVGPINSTFSTTGINTGGGGSSSSSSTTKTSSKTTASSSKTTASSSKTTTTSAKTTTTATGGGGGTIAEWQQCGGIGWGGSGTCASPYVCTVLNPYYSQVR
jgi:cellulose 1,4-beta-cellobiosidase